MSNNDVLSDRPYPSRRRLLQARTTHTRRQALKLMAAGAGSLFLAACGVSNAPNEPAQIGPEMLVAHRTEYFQEMEELFRAAARQWGIENNVTLNFETVSSEATDDYVARLSAAVEAGTPPDMVYHVRQTQQLFFLNALQDVSEVVEEAIARHGGVPRLQTLNQQINGAWYGIPYMLSGKGLWARRDLFEAAGFDVTTLDTWDKLRDASLAVSNPDAGLYGWGMTISRSGDGTDLIAGLIHDFGGSITDAAVTELTFNAPETIAAVTWLADIYTSDLYAPMRPPDIERWNDGSNNQAYLAGNIALTLNAASIYAQAKAEDTPLYQNTAYLLNPIGPSGLQRQGFSGGQFMIPRNAQNPAGGKQLALYMLEPEVFAPISQVSAGLFLPAYANHFDDPTIEREFEADPNLARMGQVALGDYTGVSYPADPSPYFDSIRAESILTDMMAQTVLTDTNPTDAVAQAAQRMANLAEEMDLFG